MQVEFVREKLELGDTMLLIRDVKQPCSSPVVAEPKNSEELPINVQLPDEEEVIIAPVKAVAFLPSILLWLKFKVRSRASLVELVSPCRTKAPWGTVAAPL